MKLGLTAFRAVVGATMFAHGAQKLFGWFGGPGLDAHRPGVRRDGHEAGQAHTRSSPARRRPAAARCSPPGLLTPLGSAATIGVMSQAIRTVHWEKGFFVTEGGFEYNLALIAARSRWPTSARARCRSTARSGRSAAGRSWALAALAAGLAGPQAPRAPRAEADEATPAPQRRTRRSRTPEPVGSPQHSSRRALAH